MSPPLPSMPSRAEARADLLAAGWEEHPDERQGPWWSAPPGQGPAGPWDLETAWKYVQLGVAMRALAERGWDVPDEWVGTPGATCGQHVRHEGRGIRRFVRVERALALEGLPALPQRPRGGW